MQNFRNLSSVTRFVSCIYDDVMEFLPAAKTNDPSLTRTEDAHEGN